MFIIRIQIGTGGVGNVSMNTSGLSGTQTSVSYSFNSQSYSLSASGGNGGGSSGGAHGGNGNVVPLALNFVPIELLYPGFGRGGDSTTPNGQNGFVIIEW